MEADPAKREDKRIGERGRKEERSTIIFGAGQRRKEEKKEKKIEEKAQAKGARPL